MERSELPFDRVHDSTVLYKKKIMKKKIILFLLLTMFTNSVIYSQARQQPVVAEQHYEYAFISIVDGKSLELNRGVYLIAISKGGTKKDDYQFYTDSTGKWACFYTIMDAYNYLDNEGWEYFSHNTNMNMKSQWMMRKKISKENLQKMVDSNTQHMSK